MTQRNSTKKLDDRLRHVSKDVDQQATKTTNEQLFPKSARMPMQPHTQRGAPSTEKQSLMTSSNTSDVLHIVKERGFVVSRNHGAADNDVVSQEEPYQMHQ